DVPNRLSFPRHLDRRQRPAGVTGNALVARLRADNPDIPVGVAHMASVAWKTLSAGTSRHGRKMLVLIVALMRMVAGWMTIHAAGICEDLGHLPKQGPRTRVTICDVGKGGWRFELRPGLSINVRLIEQERRSKQNGGRG